LSYVGDRYAAEVGGRPLRVLVASMQVGDAEAPVTMSRRRDQVRSRIAEVPAQRNAHMRGVTYALQLLFGLEPGVDGEHLDDGAHVLDAYAMANSTLCSNLPTSGASRRGAPTRTMVTGHGQVIPDLPIWVLRALRPPLPKPSPDRPAPKNATAWARAAVDGEISRLRQAQEGTRNDTLNRVAYRLGQIIGGGALAEHDIEPLLIENGIALGLRQREVVTTVHSGLRAGEGSPRGPTASASFEPPSSAPASFS